MRSPKSPPNHFTSWMIDSTYSVSSLEGLVSSKRRLHWPPNSRARPKFRLMDLAWPTCRYPLGSGGNRVHTRPPYLLVFRSSRIMSRMKLDATGVIGMEVLSLMIFLPPATARGHAGCGGDRSRGPALP